MNRLQTGVDALVRSSVSGAWRMTFTPPDAEPITVILDKNFVEVGPRLQEVLTAIERNGQHLYPRTITGKELEDLGMATRDSFLVKFLKGQPAHIEISFRPYRRFMNPVAPKVTGQLSEDDWTIPETVSFGTLAQEEITDPPKAKDGPKLGDQIKEQEKALRGGDNPISNGEILEWKYEESGDNRNEYIQPLDDRLEELFGGDKIDLDHRVRIGDVMLAVPPLSIDVNRMSTMQKIKTLRTKSSMIVKGGSSASTITMQLYFHDLEAINGTRVKAHPDHSRYYYMDGLRPLIAQFKKAPFVPIDNIYINETLGIHSVALVSLSVQTVPGFPNSIAATLVLSEFDHTAYMPQLAYLGEGINYPMFRWYYQEPLRDDLDPEERSPYRTWLDPIPEDGLTNDFTFLQADEAHLQERKQAIQDIRNMVSPSIMKERFMNPNVTGGARVGEGEDTAAFSQLGKEYKDGIMAQKLIDQYERYLKLKKEGKVSKERYKDGSGMPEGERLITKDKGLGTPKYEDSFYEIYGADESEDSLMKKSHFAPYESWMYFDMGFGKSDEKLGGIFQMRLFSKKNIELFPEEDIVKEKNGLTTIQSFGVKSVGALRQIIDRGKKAEKGYVSSLTAWQEAKSLLEQTEAEIPLLPVNMTGELIPMSMNVIYENQFSDIQLQALEAPSFQFMGGQDPYIQVQFEADEKAVEEIRKMLEQTEEFSRIYRVGISSGFLGVENHLTRLFGVDSVMPEAVSIRTIPGYPDRFHIEMTLCGFNKTQKRTEQLEGLSPIYGDKVPSKESREAGTYEAEQDNAIIEMQMNKMELYPDLELPTYDELINALPYMDAECDIYESRNGARYVDPDFYMATPETLREILREKKKNPNGMEMRMDDLMGVQLSTKTGIGKAFDGDASNLELFNQVGEKATRVSSAFSWSGEVALESGGTSNEDEQTYENDTVKEYVQDPKKVDAIPSYETWKQWGYGTDPRNYENWKAKKAQPEMWEVYNFIYKMVDKHWVEAGYVYNDKNVSFEDEAWQKITYANYKDLIAAERVRLGGSNPDSVKGLGAGSGGAMATSKKGKDGVISAKAYKATDSKPTRERIANIIKAVADVRSQWRQLKSNMRPMMDASKNCVGIMGIPLTSEAATSSSVERFLWDWKYNMEWGIKYMLRSYKAALEEDDLDYQSAPWEWMVSAFGAGTLKTDMENGFWQQVSGVLNSKYNKYTQLYATPSSPMDMTLMQQKNGYTRREMNVMNRVKEDLIDVMASDSYTYEGKKGDELREWLEAQSSAKVAEIYDKYAEKRQVGKDEQVVRDFMSEVEKASLVNNLNPDEIFPGMMTDLVEYDMRMRLARAFPTFQMFIVDEGRWMSNYRLWDNLYGFQALQSIDVYKSRKIAADTAVIRMTNIYSNLTARTMDSNYGEHDYKFWDNLVFGNPNESLLEARQELLSSLLLQTGARVHLRLGYGGVANELPVVFNGTITEMNADEMVELVCQGDGVELGNVISGDPDDTNKSLFTGLTEPRDLICELLTSKGNWFKDVINNVSGGKLFKDNPLGIQHFGQPAGEAVTGGNLSLFNFFKDPEYGEAAQNIYSSNGLATFNQWTYADGEDIPLDWASTPISKWGQPGDEMNIEVPLYNNTTWDITQTLAACSPDYIAAVHPFEMRSTLFFGKPYWGLSHRYDSRYEYSESGGGWIRYQDYEHRKPYSQFHFYDSYADIVSNNIKASEEGVYTVVIGNYDGGQTQPIYADKDIRFDKQKTAVVDVEIVGKWPGIDFWTSEKQATNFVASTLRDYIKDMYKGSLIVTGDPSVKPHDMCYMNDAMFDMNGSFNVKAVTHHFSHETGFITAIEPDVVAVTDDIAMVSLADWGTIVGTNLAAATTGYYLGARAIKKGLPSAVKGKIVSGGKLGAGKILETSLSGLIKGLPGSDPDIEDFKGLLKELKGLDQDDPKRAAKVKEIQNSADKIQAKVETWEKNGDFNTPDGDKVKGLKSKASRKANAAAVKQAANALSGGVKGAKAGRKAFGLVKGAATVLLTSTVVGGLVALGATWLTETMFEKYRRRKAAMQAVLIMPLQYQGRSYTAGINGHKGMVVGDPMGKEDSFLSGMGWNGVNGDSNFEWIMDTWNWLANAEDKDFSITREDLAQRAEGGD